MELAKGIIPAMVTPFDEQEELNEQALCLMVERFTEAGVHGLFCLGTNGEFFSLSFEEKVRIAETIVRESKGRVPVYAGAGCASTLETVRLAKRLQEAGVDALSVITPYFLAFTQQELIYHFEQVAAAVTIPVVLYNIPARTGNALQPKTVAELAKIPNIIGIKDSSGSFDTILQYIDQTPDSFSVMAGTDSLILPTLMAGGSGAIAATANVFPAQVAAIYEHFQAERYWEAEEAQRVLRDLRSAFALGTLPSVLKAVLNEIGVPAGPSRRPVAPLTPAAFSEVKQMIEKYRQQGLL
ncbi:4-hydroxy-tetrahydrodipicolinate synthase [Paenibacillus algorifonticola]|uniref:4-hydroxy-tetrahydrodipicolinate synthase n=1 Tax=Paenibacillus algorifonticola TaxID=684063 RepID=A0A1I2DAI7_9BACL|nr:4-hydroxy-tetrahydrodipicolinate synthase [Paenibacillus algorifonticola]SFE77547.1 4-hydroxy-tetrahydrodipicolinate synthase [Paenibacillus algorifonticola]